MSQIDVVGDADYLGTVARAYLAAPPSSCEERLLESVLAHTCERLGVDSDELLERIGRETPVVRAQDVFTAGWVPRGQGSDMLDDIEDGRREHAWCWP